MSMTCHWRGVDWPAKCHKHYQIKLDHDKYHSKHHKSFSALFAFICRHNISHSHPSTTARVRNFPVHCSIVFKVSDWSLATYSLLPLVITDKASSLNRQSSFNLSYAERHLDCRSISKHFLVFSSILGLRFSSCWWWTKVY